ncbi:MAG: glycosyltransferase [Thermosphaera sp.]
MSGKILILHASLNVLGGGELLVLRLSQALIEQGFDVEIWTQTPVEDEKIKDLYGNVIPTRLSVRKNRLAQLIEKMSRGRFERLRRLLFYLKEIDEAMSEADLVIDTQSNVPSGADVSYINYPAVLPPRDKAGLQWDAYNGLVNLVAKRLSKHTGRVIANSTWTACMVYKAYNVVPDIIYPPVDVEYFREVSGNAEREKLVVTVSRIVYEKNLDKILVEVAKQLPDYEFVIAGTTTEGSASVFEKLKALRDELKLTNVEFKPDIPRYELRELLGRAMFYLHPPFPEHFGISVVEAMSAGAIPIVYKDGGAWYDVVSKVSSMLGYSSISEVPSIIKSIEDDKELYSKLKEKGIENSIIFSYDNFRKSIVDKVNYILRVKKLAQEL